MKRRRFPRDLRSWTVAVVVAAAFFFEARVVTADHPYQLESITPARTETRIENGQRVRILTGNMTIVAPGCCHRGGLSSVVAIDARDFTKGTLEIDFRLGNGASAGSFELDFQKNTAAAKDSEGSWVRVNLAYDLPKGSTKRLAYSFTTGGVFRFTGQGNWFSPKGSTNTVWYRIQIRGAAVAPSVTLLHFLRQTDQGFQAIQTVRYGEPFFLEARFGTEPPESERTVTLEWGEGQRREIVVLKTGDPTVFRSRVITVERPGATTVVRP